MSRREQIERVRSAFEERFGRSPKWLVRAPGRVELIGSHVDYSDGWVMAAAIDRAVYLAASPAEVTEAKRETTLLALDENAEHRLDMDALPPPLVERGGALEWSDLPAGVAWILGARLAGRSLRVPALDIAYGGDLPAGAGVSSSAAVAVALTLAWRQAAGGSLHDLEDDLELARLCRRMENEYLGVRSGIMDPFASLFGRRGHAIFLDCRTLDYEHVALADELAVIVLDSGVRRRLAHSGYNERREECERATAIFAEHLPEIAALRDVSRRDFELHSHHLPPVLRRRARHAITEMGRVRGAAEALRRGDLNGFGELMRRSHLSSRDDYEVSIPELDELASSLWQVEGCRGARMMGGGFGGCAIALADTSRADEITRRVQDAFEERFARRPAAFASTLADGAGLLQA